MNRHNKGAGVGSYVLITGASQGMGAEVARQLARLGYNLILVARSEDKLKAVVDEILSYPEAVSVRYFRADLNNFDMIDQLIEDLGNYDIKVLINNAGHSIRRTVRETLNRFSDYERMVRINLLAQIRLTNGLLPQMVESGGGQIIYVSSFATTVHPSHFAAYAAAKAGYESYLKTLAVEYRHKGICTTRVIPPLVDTGMIGPAKHHYKGLQVLTVEQGATLITKAVTKRPEYITNWFGALGIWLEFISPRLKTLINAWVFRRGLKKAKIRAQQKLFEKEKLNK